MRPLLGSARRMVVRGWLFWFIVVPISIILNTGKFYIGLQVETILALLEFSRIIFFGEPLKQLTHPNFTDHVSLVTDHVVMGEVLRSVPLPPEPLLKPASGQK